MASSSRQQTMKVHKEEEEEIELNDADAVVDTNSGSRDGLLCTMLRLQARWSPSSLFVLRKKLVRSYLSRSQNYLGITQAEYDSNFWRRGHGGVLTDEEHCRVHAAGGLPLRALDRRGARYSMVLVRLAKTCRLRTGWGEFLRGSGVRQDDDAHVDDVVEIWAFRSPAWPTGLGLVLLHYAKEEDAEITSSSTSSESSSSVVDEQNCCSPLGPEELRAADTLTLMKSASPSSRPKPGFN